MRNTLPRTQEPTGFTDADLAQRLKDLRSEQKWSLDQLAEKSGVSRGTLSRLEKGEVSPTANVLGKLCATYGLTMSRLIATVEVQFKAHIPLQEQKSWYDSDYSFKRKSVSPPSSHLSAEVIECELISGAEVSYDKSPKLGLEHHLIMRAGELQVTIEDKCYILHEGDCLRYRLSGASMFKARGDTNTKYTLIII